MRRGEEMGGMRRGKERRGRWLGRTESGISEGEIASQANNKSGQVRSGQVK
jgi:hypothetical protein